MDREAWLACCSLWGHKESDTTEWLNNNNKVISLPSKTISLLPNKTKNSISFDDLDLIIKYFKDNHQEILDVIEIFIKNINNSGFKCDEEIISHLLNNLSNNILISTNKNNNSIFHILSKLNINDESHKIIIKTLENIKYQNAELFKTILNHQNFEENTFLMILLEMMWEIKYGMECFINLLQICVLKVLNINLILQHMYTIKLLLKILIMYKITYITI